MVDWMLLVFNTLKVLGARTFFITFGIMDKFFEETSKSRVSLGKDLLYLIGITSLYIASKHEEVRALSIKLVVKTLGHKKYTKKEIQNMEVYILQTIGFKIPKTTIFDEAIIKFKILQN